MTLSLSLIVVRCTKRAQLYTALTILYIRVYYQKAVTLVLLYRNFPKLKEFLSGLFFIAAESLIINRGKIFNFVDA
jgi:hypothetical protein